MDWVVEEEEEEEEEEQYDMADVISYRWPLR